MATTKSRSDKEPKLQEVELGSGRFPHKLPTDEETEQREYAVDFAKETQAKEIEEGKAALDRLVEQDEKQTARVEEAQEYAASVEKDSGVSAPPLTAKEADKAK